MLDTATNLSPGDVCGECHLLLSGRVTRGFHRTCYERRRRRGLYAKGQWHGVADFDGAAQPCRPTHHEPATRGKIEAMRGRAGRGVDVFSRGDAADADASPTGLGLLLVRVLGIRRCEEVYFGVTR